MILVILLYALSASSLTIGKAMLCYAEPFFFLAVRMISVGALLLLFSWWKKHQIRMLVWADLFRFLFMGFVHIFLAFGLELLALRAMESHQVALLYNLSPFITALCSYIWLGEMLGFRKKVGLAIAFCAFLPDIVGHYNTAFCGVFFSWGYASMVGAVIATVLGWIVMRDLIIRGYTPSFINGVGMSVGGLLALCTSFFVEKWSPLPVISWSHFIYLSTLIAFLNDVLFYNFYGRMLRRYSATFLSFAGFLLPIITALFGLIFLGEAVTIRFIISAAFVTLGLTIFYSEELSQGYEAKIGDRQ
jgi:drug/metabolite transporter (DMT)-like permease